MPQLHETLVSSVGGAPLNPYKQSMVRLLSCVGLQHYGTPSAAMPTRTSDEEARIAKHLEETAISVARHQESVRSRNIRLNKRKPTSAMMAVMESVSTAFPLTSSAHASDSDTLPADMRQERAASTTIFLSFEDSVEWKSFLASFAPNERFGVTVLRRLSVELWRAHQQNVCLWCWFPRTMCMCAELDAYRATLPSHVLDQHVEITMLLHSEELMRSTNSGHIAAYLLGAPLRVWGLREDDAFLQGLPPMELRAVTSGDSSETNVSSPTPSSTAAPTSVFHAALYPSSDAVQIHDFIQQHRLHQYQDADTNNAIAEAEEDPVHLAGVSAPINGIAEGETLAAVATTTDTTSFLRPGKGYSLNGGPACVSSGAKRAGYSVSPGKVHLILLDSTWGQALSLNRHITRSVPRLSLTISPDYESLFQALRKRTRDMAVSTLEATSMAVEQCVRAMGYAEEAATTAQTLTQAMKNFVDARCLLKYTDAQFTNTAMALEEFRGRRDESRRAEAARWQDLLASRMDHDEAARSLRLPPVLNYCYCCDCVIGWHRMGEHVMGRNHRTALERNPAGTPSVYSRTVVVPDFSRPRRCHFGASTAETHSRLDPDPSV